ncbi:MAG: hypothetical protein JRN42_05385 [Nitrososphaerota archaeon]|nr:hypothetical protein [Nitrososphaerota archaeon]
MIDDTDTRTTTDVETIDGFEPLNVPRSNIAPRKITCEELTELLIEHKGWGRRDAQYCRSRARAFCRALGRTFDEPAYKLFDESFGERLAAVTDELSGKPNAKRGAARNIRWTATELRGLYESLSVDPTLDLDFAAALKQAMDAKGWSPTRLINELEARYGVEHHGTIYNYLRRTHQPRTKKGVEVVARLETVLELKPGTLHTRAFSEPKLLKAPGGQPNKYRERQSELSREKYQLKAMPPQFAKLWPEITHWRSQSSFMLPGGKYVAVKKPWRSAATEKMNRYYLLRFMGFLLLPAPNKPVYELTQQEQWRSGKGLTLKELRFSQWFDTELLHEYIQWRKARQWNGELTAECIDLVQSVSLLCKYAHSFLNMHPDLAHHFGKRKMERKAWHKCVNEKIFTPLKEMLTQLRRERPKTLSRIPEEALKHVLHDEDPMVLMQEMVAQMKRDAPAKNRPVHHGIHQRDVAIVHLLLEIPLRAKNIIWMKLGTSVYRDKDSGLWWVDIPKSHLKNGTGPDAQPIHRELSPEASKALETYVNEGRQALDPEGSSNTLFLVERKAGKKKRSKADLGITQVALDHLLTKYLRRYFGIGSGPHFFRHLLATAILRADPSAIDAAAAVLNISHDVCRERYAHLLQQDGLDRANKFLKEKRLKHQVLYGKGKGKTRA